MIGIPGDDYARKTAMRYHRNLIARFNQTEMDRFDAATDPAEIDRYQSSVKKALIWISTIIGLVTAAVFLAILFKKQ